MKTLKLLVTVEVGTETRFILRNDSEAGIAACIGQLLQQQVAGITVGQVPLVSVSIPDRCACDGDKFEDPVVTELKERVGL